MSNLYGNASETTESHNGSIVSIICFLQEEDLTLVKEEVNALLDSFSPQFVCLTSVPIASDLFSYSFDSLYNQLHQEEQNGKVVLIEKGKYYIISGLSESLIRKWLKRQTRKEDIDSKNNDVKEPSFIDAFGYLSQKSNIKQEFTDSSYELNKRFNNTNILDVDTSKKAGKQQYNRQEVEAKKKQSKKKKVYRSHVCNESKENNTRATKQYFANALNRKRKVATEKSTLWHDSPAKVGKLSMIKLEASKKILNKAVNRKRACVAHTKIKKYRVTVHSTKYEENTDKENDEIFTKLVKKKKKDSDSDYTAWLREKTNLPFNERPGCSQDVYLYPLSGSRRKGRSQGQREAVPAAATEKYPEQVSVGQRHTSLPSLDQIVTSSLPENQRSKRPIRITNSMSYTGEQVVTMRLQGIPARNRQKGPPSEARHPQYASVTSRLNSFRNWPSTTHQSASRMADYGFFHTGRLDLVRCFQCGIGLKDWSEPDEPLFEHIKHSPDCPFLPQLLGVDLLSAYKVNLVPGNAQPADARPPPVEDPNESAQGATGGAASSYRAPQFSSITERMRSFNNFSRVLTQTPLELAEAGFYYTGEGDICRCFWCDGGLTRWDPQDDPWIQHAKWFPSCPYVRQVKGNEFVSLIQQAIASTDEEENTTAGRGNVVQGLAGLTLHPLTAFLSSPAAQAVLEMGYSRNAVQLAVSDLTDQNKQNYTSQDIVEALTRRVDAGETLPVDTPPRDPAEERAELEAINQQLRNVMTCIKCKNREVSILFIPCTHHRVCEPCAQNMTKCPVCNQDIVDKVKTYMS